MRNKLLFAAGLSLTLLAQQANALEVDRAVLPRLTVGGRLIATPSATDLNGTAGTADVKTNEVDISDSSLLLRFDKRVYSGEGVAGAIVGFTKPDQDSDLPDDIFFHQLNAFYWNRDFQVLVGRTRLRNTLLEFPTVRDDDLLEYTHVPNGSSFAENDQYQIYGTMVSADWYVDRKNQALSIWLEGRTETDTTGTKTAAENLNSAGIGYTYEVPEQVRYVQRLRQAGVLFDTQKIEGVTGDDKMSALIAGAEWNLNQDPSKNWSAAVQAIVNDGIEGAGIATHIGREREKSKSLVASLRYTGRPALLTRSQAAVTLAWKDYPDQTEASQYSIAPSYVYRLGHGIDLLAQYIYTKREDGLAAATGFESENAILFGLAFGFDQTFNDNIGERMSILNLEHGYIQ